MTSSRTTKIIYVNHITAYLDICKKKKKKKAISDMSGTYRGNHLACSTQGSSPDSQQRRPPSQQKHLTSSLRPREGENVSSSPEEALRDFPNRKLQDFPFYRETKSLCCPQKPGKPLGVRSKLIFKIKQNKSVHHRGRCSAG